MRIKKFAFFMSKMSTIVAIKAQIARKRLINSNLLPKVLQLKTQVNYF